MDTPVTYKVLKDLDAHVAGETIDGAGYTSEQLAELIADGTLEPVINEDAYETVEVDQAYLDAHPEEVANGMKLGDTLTRLKNPPADPAAPAVEGADTTEADAAAEKPAEEADVEASAEEAAPALPVENTMRYQGKDVIATNDHEVNGVTYHEVRLADGSTYDLNDEDFKLIVDSAK